LLSPQAESIVLNHREPFGMKQLRGELLVWRQGGVFSFE
jgi:hypothetical protein